jgi:hypothetical protein
MKNYDAIKCRTVCMKIASVLYNTNFKNIEMSKGHFDNSRPLTIISKDNRLIDQFVVYIFEPRRAM